MSHDVRSKYNLVPTSNPSGVIHKLKNKLNKIIKLLVLTNYLIMNLIKVKLILNIFFIVYHYDHYDYIIFIAYHYEHYETIINIMKQL